MAFLQGWHRHMDQALAADASLAAELALVGIANMSTVSTNSLIKLGSIHERFVQDLVENSGDLVGMQPWEKHQVRQANAGMARIFLVAVTSQVFFANVP